jgi:mRNA interferase HicA
MGCILIQHGGNHDWHQNSDTGSFQPIPRHNDINEKLAKKIIKRLQNY